MRPPRHHSSSTGHAALTRPAARGLHTETDFSVLFEAWETPTLQRTVDPADLAAGNSSPWEPRATSERPTLPAPADDVAESSTRIRTHPPPALTALRVDDLRS